MDALPKTPRGWRIALVVVMALTLIYAVANFQYFWSRTNVNSYSYPPGKAWTFDGITYQVVKREVVTELHSKSSKTPTVATPGSVFVVYHVDVSGYHYDRDDRKANTCDFFLEGANGRQWLPTLGIRADKPITCQFEDNPPTEQQIAPIFQVPAGDVDSLKGIKSRSRLARPMPLLREPQ